MKWVKLFFCCFLFFFLESCAKKVPNLYVKCTYTDYAYKSIKYHWNFVLNFNKHTVKNLIFADVREGKLTIENDRYIFIFPAVQNSYFETRVIINRTSGISTVEQGIEPFNLDNPKNSLMIGQCKKAKSQNL
ncbi:Uncharacterised protein [Legionella spiritensis]|nr:Uncharacterised protein [Legionella spiritensis]